MVSSARVIREAISPRRLMAMRAVPGTGSMESHVSMSSRCGSPWRVFAAPGAHVRIP